MIQLFWIPLTDDFGQALIVPVVEIKHIRDDPDGAGAIITYKDGTELHVTDTAADIATAIADLRDAVLAAV